MKSFLLILLVALTSSTAISAEPTGFGCYVLDYKMGDFTPELWTKHVRVMKAAGMNTFVASYAGHQRLAYMIDIAIEEGMLETSIPIVLMPRNGESRFRAVMGDAQYEQHVAEEAAAGGPLPGFAPIQLLGEQHVRRKARQIAKYADRWPELIAYGFDEPGHGKPLTEEQLTNLKEMYDRYHKLDYRLASSVMHPNMFNLVPHLDIVITNCILGANPGIKQVKDECERLGKEFWAYEINNRRGTTKMIRWHVGYWTWQTGPRVHLSWSWIDYLTSDFDTQMGEIKDRIASRNELIALGPEQDRMAQLQSEINGMTSKLKKLEAQRAEMLAEPRMNPRLIAHAEGVKDFHYLQDTEERLQQMRAGWDWEGWPWDEWVRGRDERGSGERYSVPDLDFDDLLPSRGR